MRLFAITGRREELHRDLREEEPRPSTSMAPQQDTQHHYHCFIIDNRQEALERNVSRNIREAESKRPNVMDVKGNEIDHNRLNLDFNGQIQSANDNEAGALLFVPNQFMCTAMMDEDYLIVVAHVDEGVEQKIRNGEFIDFNRLLPRDHIQMQQDNHSELINNNEHLTCSTSSPGSSEFMIGSFARWEQAFHLFSNIYTRQFPQKASELIQYNHVIHRASMTYSWSNVYAYDMDFRLHMAHHPLRSWSVILQQAWNLRLKDGDEHERCTSQSGNGSGRKREICFRYNAGKCTYGFHCKFDHRCGICGKHGHGAHNCRRILSDRNDWGGHDRNHDQKDRKDKKCDFQPGNGGSSNSSSIAV